MPHSSIDTEVHWTKSGWHGWIYGWKLHIACAVAAVWIPLSAELTSANVADNELAPALIHELPPEAHLILGDLHYNAPNVREVCEQTDRLLVTTQYGPYPHTDAGVEVRRIFHTPRQAAAVRSLAIENFNEHFKGIFDGHGQVPTKGLFNTLRFALGAILVYQLALLYRFQHGLDLNIGLKAFIKAMCFMTKPQLSRLISSSGVIWACRIIERNTCGFKSPGWFGTVTSKFPRLN